MYFSYINILKESGVDAMFANKIINNKQLSLLEEIYLLASKCNTIVELKKSVFSFDLCQLKIISKNTVFSCGNIGADIMFIGEAPGQKEDEKGVPFCGRSGKLLDNMLASVSMTREDIYITNAIFWRPPANRNPNQEELELCKPFLEKHIQLVNPKIIVTLGGVSTKLLLNLSESISIIRGDIYDYTNKFLNKTIPCLPTFHPAYLLRSHGQKKYAWEDLKKLKDLYKTL